MRSIVVASTLASMVMGSALAQNASPATAPADDPGRAALPIIDRTPAQSDKPANPAVKTSEGNNPGAPAAGANSFTEGQAKSRIEDRGYSAVSGLTKDDKGVWRGMAMKDGKSVRVSLDFQGNVVAE